MPLRETRAISRSSATASAGSRWWTTSEVWATSNERSGKGSDRPSPTTSSRPATRATAGRAMRAASITSNRESIPVTCSDWPRRAASARSDDGDVRAARADVEERAWLGGWDEAVDGDPAQPHAQHAIDPAQVPQVAGELVEVVERPVQQLLDPGQPFHRLRLHRRSGYGPRPLRAGTLAPMPRPTARRLALAQGFVAALAIAVVAAPALAAITTTYPVQSSGDRGTDVAALQELFSYHQRAVSSGGAEARGASRPARATRSSSPSTGSSAARPTPRSGRSRRVAACP